MKRLAALIDALVFTSARNGKLRLMADYFAHTPDPDRGYGLAALTGTLAFTEAKPAAIRALVAERVDPALFAWSYDFVGDLAETVALIWPEPADGAHAGPALSDVVTALATARRADVPNLVTGWLDALDASSRFALLKLITGALRVGVSGRLAKTALAQWSGIPLAEIEELWHGLSPPYGELFAWLEGRAPRPEAALASGFRPLMLANPLDEPDLATLDPQAYAAEWKWDGIRVQLVGRVLGEARLYSRTGDDVAGAFPEIAERLAFDAVLDGELLVVRDGQVAPFNDLQQRLNRKKPTAALVRSHPAHVRLYDILFDGAEDLRPLGFCDRRRRLEDWFARTAPAGMDLSPMIPFASWEELAAVRSEARENGIEGVMLKRVDSPYQGGRPRGPWFKWKRDPLTLDVVVMYAQRGHGKRSSFYSDYTFGAWTEDADGAPVLLPVGKAYFGFTDEELGQLDRWVRTHTVRRYGPVREVSPGLVLEVAFDSVHRSTRHRSGLAMRFPRIHRIRWDKPAAEADRLGTLARMVVD
jgi:DNA ligase-1